MFVIPPKGGRVRPEAAGKGLGALLEDIGESLYGWRDSLPAPVLVQVLPSSPEDSDHQST
jgi:hypothetical protein